MFTKIFITLLLFWVLISIIDILLSIYTKQTQLKEIKKENAFKEEIRNNTRERIEQSIKEGKYR